VLPAGQRSWICVQPNNQFAVNGQTGWMGQTGIGNGQECYFAFPLLGNNKWVTATSVFGSPNEAGFVLLGTEGAGLDHDVGTLSINAPPATLFPSTTIDPSATYRNYGTNNETFDVYFLIDSAGVNIYSETANISLDAGNQTAVTFASWTSGPNSGITYDITSFTVLAGDQNPGNDTLSRQTTTISVFWEILDPPLYPIPGAGMSETTGHDGYYYVFGVRNGAVYDDTILIYDIANNQWLDGGTNPFGAGSYGTANFINGKFYRLGGTIVFANPLQRLDILDPPSSWTAGATPPVGFLDQITGVYKDSLLYVFGGGNWSMTPVTAVYIYDTYNNYWDVATPFPAPGRGAMAGGIIDSFAILAFGYTAANAYDNNYIVGVIDQANPMSITWGSWAPIPGAQGCRRVPSGVDDVNGQLWVIGGQVSTGQLDRTLSYDPYTDTWTDWNMPKPQSVCNVTPIPVTLTAAGDLGVFVGGGYASGIMYLGDHEVFHTGFSVGIAEQPGDQGATPGFGFAPNTANPVKGYTAITYSTVTSGRVSLLVYDATGRLVRTLVNRVLEHAGAKTVYWNGQDDAHRDVANGIYFLRLDAEGQTDTYKMIFVR
ncbi:T9SS type A sorting domain-containing protein, partial [candidate division WOR-3 bacterium]|nr:T9SS type A sorting domain-containing protein [candidate division WOR-3 bacterium]